MCLCFIICNSSPPTLVSFINVANNGFLNYGVRDQGYAVFARVTEGMDVVDKIESVQVIPQINHRPVTDIRMTMYLEKE